MSDRLHLPVVGCVPFDVDPPGFALPILADPLRPNLRLVQEQDEFRDLIGSFRILEGHIARVIPVPEGNVAALNGPMIHAFRTVDDAMHVGTLEKLRPILAKFAEEDGYPAIALQAAELIGSIDQRIRARARVFDLIKSQTGEGSARDFYEGSALRSALWDRVLRTAATEEAARRILRVRPKLDAYFEGGKIRLDLTALSSDDRVAINEAQLAVDLEAEFIPSASGHSISSVETHVVNPVGAGQVSDILGKVRRAGRQEDRLAILLASILRDRQLGMSALHQYSEERAQFARWALQEIASTLSQEGDVANCPSDEQLIAELVPVFFKKQYPLSRGQLLLALAEHLGSSPLVSAAIKRTLDRTQSMYVGYYRPQIERFLTKTGMRNAVQN